MSWALPTQALRDTRREGVFRSKIRAGQAGLILWCAEEDCISETRASSPAITSSRADVSGLLGESRIAGLPVTRFTEHARCVLSQEASCPSFSTSEFFLGFMRQIPEGNDGAVLDS